MIRERNKLQFLVEAALCIALTIVLQRLKLFRMPQGGSVTLAMVPLCVLARRRGFWRAAVAGAAAGVMEMILGGYMVHPIQAALDYPVAFAAYALAAIGRSDWFGVLLGGLARYACSVASGVIFFASYAPQGSSPLIYSLVYNGGYMAANIVIAMIIVPLMMPRLRRL